MFGSFTSSLRVFTLCQTKTGNATEEEFVCDAPRSAFHSEFKSAFSLKSLFFFVLVLFYFEAKQSHLPTADLGAIHNTNEFYTCSHSVSVSTGHLAALSQ